MSPHLKAEELRAQLSLRGLDTRGTKPMLVKRLEAAMQREGEKESTAVTGEAAIADGSRAESGSAKEKKAGVDGVSNGRGKRKRVSVDADDGRKEGEGLYEENLKKCTIRELRALARHCRVSTFGKEEFVKRLTRGCVAEIPQKTALGMKLNTILDPYTATLIELLIGNEMRIQALIRALIAQEERNAGMMLNTILDPYTANLIELLIRNEMILRALIALEERNVGEEPKAIEEEKLVTAAKKDGAILGQRLPDDVESSFHALQKEFFEAPEVSSDPDGSQSHSEFSGEFKVSNCIETSSDPYRLYSFSICMDLLNKVENISDEIYLKGLKAFEKVNFRIAFVMMPEFRRGPVLKLM